MMGRQDVDSWLLFETFLRRDLSLRRNVENRDRKLFPPFTGLNRHPSTRSGLSLRGNRAETILWRRFMENGPKVIKKNRFLSSSSRFPFNLSSSYNPHS